MPKTKKMKRARSPGEDLENQWDYKNELEELDATLPEVIFNKEMAELSATLPEVKIKTEKPSQKDYQPKTYDTQLVMSEKRSTLPEVKIKTEKPSQKDYRPKTYNIPLEMSEKRSTLPEVKIKTKEPSQKDYRPKTCNIPLEMSEKRSTLPEVKIKTEKSSQKDYRPITYNIPLEMSEKRSTFPEVKVKIEKPSQKDYRPKNYNIPLEMSEKRLKILCKPELPGLQPSPGKDLKSQLGYENNLEELNALLPEVKFKGEMAELIATLPEVKIKTEQPSQSQPVKDYRPKAYIPLEMSEKRLKILCEIKLREMQINSLEEIERIQKSTIGEHGKSRYEERRRDRLTASLFGMVCKKRKSTPCENHVRRILYPSYFSNFDMIYGLTFEIYAIKLFERITGKTVEPAGLFIDAEYGFLGASPDGLVVGEDSLVEVKCFPSLARCGMSIVQAARRKKGFPLYVDSYGELELNRRHNFYYQIQGQLRVCRKTRCYLVAFVNIETPIQILVIEKDNEFIEEMVEKLVDFYKSYVLPELVLRFPVDRNAPWMYG